MDSSSLRGDGFVLPHGRDANDAGEGMDASSLPVEACANGVMDPSSLVNALGNDLFSSSTPRTPATYRGTNSAAAKPAKAPGRITKVEFASYADCTAGRARNRMCTAGGGSLRTTGVWTWYCAWRVCRVGVNLTGPAN